MILDAIVQPEEGETAEETLRDFEEQEAISLPYFNPETLVNCPLSTITCSTKEFDNIKLFYHPDEQPLFGTGSFSFYIARPGSGPRDCVDWKKENIKVTALGFDGNWGECILLRVPYGAHIRIHYPDPDSPSSGVQRVQDCIFPNVAVPTNFLGSNIMFNPPRDLSNANILYL